MFSARSEFPTAPNRWSSRRDEARARGERLLDLTESNPTAVGLDYPAAAILEALADPRALRYEPDPRGLPAAREAIAARLAAAGTPVDASRIVLAASTSEAYSLLFRLLCDPGDSVLVPAPGYPLFDMLARLDSIWPARYPLDADDGWSLDAEAPERSAPAGTRAAVVVSPNNPTGRFLHRGERAALEDACRRRRWAVIADEVFADYGAGEDADRVLCAASSASVLTFSLGGLSKSAGLPQVKLAWIAIGGPDEAAAAALGRLEVAADAYLSVSSQVQWALPRLLEAGDEVRPRIRERVERNRAALGSALAGTPARLLPAEGGWYGVVQLPATRTGEEWALRLLERHRVLVHPGYFYDFPGEAYVIASLLPPADIFDEAAGRLAARAAADTR
jgi:hypothetical protein